MGESSGSAPIINDSFGAPMNPETLTPNFGQIAGVGSGQEGFDPFMPNGFSEFFTPGMPTMLSSPYIAPGTGSASPPAGGTSNTISPPAASSGSIASTPAPVSMFNGQPVPSNTSNLGPTQQNSLMFDQPVTGGPQQYQSPSMASSPLQSYMLDPAAQTQLAFQQSGQQSPFAGPV
jgi:hypothetical protein